MAAQGQKQLFTVEDYYKMAEVGIIKPDARVELINGEIIEMSPSNSNHAGHIIRIEKFLGKIVNDLALISTQNPLHISQLLEPEPDVAILKPSPHFYIEHHPTPQDVYLLIEVADSSLSYDRTTKLPIYASAGVAEVWIVNLRGRRVEMNRFPEPEKKKYKVRELAYIGDSLVLPVLNMMIAVSDILMVKP